MTEQVVVVELRPGQKINFVTEAVQTTPFGQREVKEAKIALSYEEILERFKPTETKQRKQNVPKAVREFNRYSSTTPPVLDSGKWVTGATANLEKVTRDLLAHVRNLPDTLYPLVSTKARTALNGLTSHKLFTEEEQNTLKEFLTKLPAAAAV